MELEIEQIKMRLNVLAIELLHVGDRVDVATAQGKHLRAASGAVFQAILNLDELGKAA